MPVQGIDFKDIELVILNGRLLAIHASSGKGLVERLGINTSKPQQIDAKNRPSSVTELVSRLGHSASRTSVILAVRSPANDDSGSCNVSMTRDANETPQAFNTELMLSLGRSASRTSVILVIRSPVNDDSGSRNASMTRDANETPQVFRYVSTSRRTSVSAGCAIRAKARGAE